MRTVTQIHRRRGRTALSLVLVMALVMGLLSSVLAAPAAAKSVRSAVVTSVTGDVTYTKAGGSRAISVYTDLSLNQGDLITTGSGASVVLSIVDRNDEITIGENAEIYISELTEEGGKKSKVKSWAGSVWSKVKSLVSSEDEFEVETPTAVMGVRGTHFFVGIDPKTGRSYLTVGSGVVRATTTVAAGSRDGAGDGQNSAAGSGTASERNDVVTVYPSQQIFLDTRDQTGDLKTKVEYVDIEQLVSQASPSVIEAIIRNLSDIREETEKMKERLTEEQGKGAQKPDADSSLLYLNGVELNKVIENFDEFIPNLAKAAIDAKKIDQKLIDQVNENIKDPEKKLDPSKVKPLDKTAGLDPALEKQKQQIMDKLEAERRQKLEAEQKQLLENQQRLAALLAKVEADKKRQEEANKQAAQEAAKKAEEALKAQLNEAARKAFEENNKKNQESAVKTPSSGPSNPGSSSGSGSTEDVPAVPVLVNPTTETTAVVNENVQIRLTAQSGSDVRLRAKGSQQTLAAAKGAGSSTPVTLTFKPSQVGKLELEATASSSAGTSSALAIPVITVVPAAPAIVSPVNNVTASKGEPIVIKLKAAADTTIQLSDQQTVLASAPGKGADEVTFSLSNLPVGVNSLTAYAVKNGIRSAGAQLPSITIQGTQPVVLPKVTLRQDEAAANGQVKLRLDMENFDADHAFYGVQAHLLYDSHVLTYAGPTNLPDNGVTIFKGANAAETLTQKPAVGNKSELIYAGVQFQTAASGPVPEIVIGQNSAPLVTIPLIIQSGAPNTTPVQLLYVKVVDKQGNPVYELPLGSQGAVSVQLSH
ncbi:FecR family protein [Paenibacillus sp. UNCCL117]|uniref:FecR family protein n=1 Tax=unclassified Paenibacillus TaxID=185978 RepID=UPI0008924440|nr:MULTISPECIES: FecR domain-containing protein [unclassified Paenibacillus]SDC22879.1 FecR protein [Paenibacillus sp. cl123]SFW19152.1 FecR family protein [Paenibacillus sp. UNCCL117]